MLRLYRTINRSSLRAVAAQVGISTPTLLRIETGQPGLDAETLLKLWAWLLGPHGTDA